MYDRTSVRSSAPASRADVNIASRSMSEACGTTVSRTACRRKSPGTSRPGIAITSAVFAYHRNAQMRSRKPRYRKAKRPQTSGYQLYLRGRMTVRKCGLLTLRRLSCANNANTLGTKSILPTASSFTFTATSRCSSTVQFNRDNCNMNPMNAPSGPASLWQEARHTDGRVYYYNVQTKATQWQKPFELMTPVEVRTVAS